MNRETEHPLGPLVKCPGCDTGLHEDDPSQVVHMERYHPEIIEKRRMLAGIPPETLAHAELRRKILERRTYCRD